MDKPFHTFDNRCKDLDYVRQCHLLPASYTLQQDKPFYRQAHHNGYKPLIQNNGRENQQDPPAAPERFSVSSLVQAGKSFCMILHKHDSQYNDQYSLKTLVFSPLFTSSLRLFDFDKIIMEGDSALAFTIITHIRRDGLHIEVFRIIDILPPALIHHDCIGWNGLR